MNALYIGGFNLPDKNAAAQRVVANAKLLQDLGYKTRLIGLSESEETLLYQGLDCLNWEYPKTLRQWYHYLTSIRRFIPVIEADNPSLIIAYNYPAFALWRLKQYCKKHGVKLIADCTEWYTPEGRMLFRTIKRIDTYLRMKVIQPKLDGVISISRFLHRYYCSRGAKSVVLPPLVDTHDPKWSCQATLRRDDGILRLVYAGSPGHKDRLDIIVRAIVDQSITRKILFTIIGLDKSQFIELYGFTGDIPEYVIFKGRIPHSEVMTCLFTSDFQVFVREDNITTRAGFPTKFVESVTAGLPVITNLTSNLDEYLYENRNGCVLDASSEATLRASLADVLSKTNEQIMTIKRTIDRTTFDYRHYLSRMSVFIESL